MLASGWMGAGSFYGTFAEANAALADAVTGGRLTTRQPSEARIFSEAAVEVNRASKYVEQVARNDAKTAVFCGGSTLTSFIGTDSGNCSLGQGIVSAVMGATMRGSGGGAGVFGGADDVGLVNPIVGMKNAGDYIMTVANVLILYDRANNAKIDTDEGFGDAISNGIGKVGATAAKKIPVIGTLLDELAPFGWMLLALGAMLAIYIPFLPLIAWVGGMIAYTASFIEGLVAMPLHSMSHMHTDGEGMGQQTSHGYLFFLNTFARPPLMVIAFFIAGGLVIALGTVATMMFLPAMANVQGNSMTSVASIIGFIVIYFVLMNIIINGCFDLIHVIPDQVIGFVGSGSVNTSLGRDAEGKINALYMAGVRGGQGAGQANIQRANQRAFQSNQAVRGKANLSEGDGGRK
jgi:conjugal transfer/type IV secretion protein DotA/TraY